MSTNISQLIEEILLYLPNIKNVWSTDLLHLVLSKGGGSRNTRLAYTRKRSKQFAKDLKTFYEGTGYSCMDQDVYRNAYFAQAIQKAAKQGLTKWVEIGPGALGTLTKLILRSNSRTEVVAVEAVDSSVKLLKSKLRTWTQKGRATVVEGVGGKVPIEGVNCEVLIAEILGHIASNEGWTATLHALGKQNPRWKETIQQIIPAYYGTKMVPVDISTACKLDSDLVVGSNLAFVSSLPFSQIQLTHQHGFFERYSALEELQHGGGRDPRMFETVFIVSESRPFHGLSLIHI